MAKNNLHKSWYEEQFLSKKDPGSDLFIEGALHFQQRAIEELEKKKKLTQALGSFIGQLYAISVINGLINNIKNLKSQ